MAIERLNEPKHLSVDFTADEYAAFERSADTSGQSLNDVVYAALLVKLGATMQSFVAENGLQNLVIEVNITGVEDDTTEDELDFIDQRLGSALRDDGSIDYAILDAKTEIVDLDEWEQNP